MFRNFMVPIPSVVTAIPGAEFPLTGTKEMQNGWMPAVVDWHLGRNPNKNMGYPLPKSSLAFSNLHLHGLLRALFSMAPQVFLFCCQVYYLMVN